MQKVKLIQLLHRLTPREWEALALFLRSPYFNEDEEILPLFRALREAAEEGKTDQLEKEKLYRTLYPGRGYDAKAFTYVLSKLNRLTEEFLRQQRMENEGNLADLLLLDELSERGADKHYDYHERRLEDRLAGAADNFRTYDERARLSAVRERHFERTRTRRFDPQLQRAAEALDRHYFLSRLNYACGMLDRQTIFQDEYDVGISEEWLAHLRDRPVFDDPLIRLFYNILLALREEEEEAHFLRLRKAIRGFQAAEPTEVLRGVYLFAINYCARKIRRDRNEYLTEALDLYLDGIRGGFLLDRGELSPWTFTNVCKLMLRLRRYVEAENFIDAHAEQLPEAFRENAEHYNRAELYYHTQRLDRAQEELNRVAYSDLNYYLGARVLLTKIFFEKEAEEALLSILASFTIFLKRNKKISGDIKAAYLNFCKILLRILRTPAEKRERLAEVIQTTQPLTDRAWLATINAGAISPRR